MTEPETKRIEVMLHPNEMKRDYPIGKEYISQGKKYKVLGEYEEARQSTSFASFPSFLVEEVI